MIAQHARLARVLGEQLDLPQRVLDGSRRVVRTMGRRGMARRSSPASRSRWPRASCSSQSSSRSRTGPTESTPRSVWRRADRGRSSTLVSCTLLCADAEKIFDGLDAAGSWDAVIDAEPSLAIVLTEDECDAALLAIANFVDLKSPYTLGHSHAVADLAATAGRGSACRPARCDCSTAPVSCTTSVGSASRTRSGTRRDRSARASGSACACTRTTASACSSSQRRSRPSRGSRCSTVNGSTALAIRAVCRAARSRARRASSVPPTRTKRCGNPGPTVPRGLRTTRRESFDDEVRVGRLDGDVVEAVLTAAGHRVVRRREGPAGLTAREVEVLRLLAQGLSNEGHRGPTRDHAEDRRQPHRAHLLEDRRHEPHRGEPVRDADTACSRRKASPTLP